MLGHHHGHNAERDDLTGEHRLTDIGQIVLAALFAVVWMGDMFLNLTNMLNDHVSLWVQVPVGVVLLVLAGVLARRGLSTVFGQERETPGVIDSGVFGLVRHPIYLGEILLYLGLFMLNMSLAALGVTVLAFCFLHFAANQEEGLLLARFGDEYSSYMAQVPMWAPRICCRGQKEKP